MQNLLFLQLVSKNVSQQETFTRSNLQARVYESNSCLRTKSEQTRGKKRRKQKGTISNQINHHKFSYYFFFFLVSDQTSKNARIKSKNKDTKKRQWFQIPFGQKNKNIFSQRANKTFCSTSVHEADCSVKENDGASTSVFAQHSAPNGRVRIGSLFFFFFCRARLLGNHLNNKRKPKSTKQKNVCDILSVSLCFVCFCLISGMRVGTLVFGIVGTLLDGLSAHVAHDVAGRNAAATLVAHTSTTHVLLSAPANTRKLRQKERDTHLEITAKRRNQITIKHKRTTKRASNHNQGREEIIKSQSRKREPQREGIKSKSRKR